MLLLLIIVFIFFQSDRALPSFIQGEKWNLNLRICKIAQRPVPALLSFTVALQALLSAGT